MNIRRKTLSLALAALLLLCGILSACTAQNTPTPPTETTESHVHTPGDFWEVNLKKHWQYCTEDNDFINVADHTFTDDVCSVCGAHKKTRTDGKTEILLYNDKNDPILRAIYDKDENVMRYTIENTYGEDGKISLRKAFREKKLAYEEKFTTEADVHYRNEYTVYSQSGKTLYTYNRYGTLTGKATYDTNDTVLTEESTDIVYDQNGLPLSLVTTINGKVTYTALYTVKTEGGVSKSVLTQTTSFSDKGEKTVVFYNDKELSDRSEHYDAEGTLLHTYTYKYHYNQETGALDYYQKIEGDIVWEEFMYDNEDGKHFLYLHVIYDKDGNPVSVTEYDEFGNIVKS